MPDRCQDTHSADLHMPPAAHASTPAIASYAGKQGSNVARMWQAAPGNPPLGKVGRAATIGKTIIWVLRSP
jgi:hypothetical protein